MALNIQSIKKELEETPWEDGDVDGIKVRRVFLGTVMSLTPSGKFYTPFACSNVQACRTCADANEGPCDEETPCSEEGHCEVCRDARWHQEAESDLQSINANLESGEGDPCDLFAAQYEETEVLDEESGL